MGYAIIAITIGIAWIVVVPLLVQCYAARQRERAWKALGDSLLPTTGRVRSSSVPPEQVLGQVVEALAGRRVEQMRELGMGYGPEQLRQVADAYGISPEPDGGG